MGLWYSKIIWPAFKVSALCFIFLQLIASRSKCNFLPSGARVVYIFSVFAFLLFIYTQSSFLSLFDQSFLCCCLFTQVSCAVVIHSSYSVCVRFILCLFQFVYSSPVLLSLNPPVWSPLTAAPCFQSVTCSPPLIKLIRT